MFINFIENNALNNKYTKWYIKIIYHAKCRGIITGNIEKHHIVPRSFKKEWIKENDNIVYLTYREHFIVHKLLTKMFTKIYYQKMLYALGLLMGKHKEFLIKNSRLFHTMKVEYSIHNIAKSQTTKDKISKALTGRSKETHEYIAKAAEKTSKTLLDPNGVNQTVGIQKRKEWMNSLSDEERKIKLGRPKTEEQKKKMSDLRKSQTADNCERVRKSKITRKLRYDNMSPEQRQKELGKSKGRRWYHNDILRSSKTFFPDDVPDGWVLGMIIYEKN